MITTCTECGEECTAVDGYSDCCNEPVITVYGTVSVQYSDPDGYDRSGASDGRGHVYTDAEGGL
jgi:hypothetical protein